MRVVVFSLPRGVVVVVFVSNNRNECKGVVSNKMSDDSGVPTKGVVVAVCSPTRGVVLMVVVFSPNKKCEMSAVDSKHQRKWWWSFLQAEE